MEVRSFLGLTSYYRRFVRAFANIVAPLHVLTRKDVPFRWTPECQAAFDRLKAALTSSPVTAFPDFKLPFRLYKDASKLGHGAILMQHQEGKERTIACASKALNKSEQNYPTTATIL